MTDRQIKYCVACGTDTERYTKEGQIEIGRCIPCQIRRSANSSAKKKQRPETPSPIPKAARKSANLGRPSKVERNKLVCADIDAGMDLNEAAKQHGISRQYILIVLRNKKRADTGIDERVKPFEGLYAARDHALMAEIVGAGGDVTKHIGA